MLWNLLGLVCTIYSAVEIARCWRLADGGAASCFGAVDVRTGRPLRVTLDRRTRDRGQLGR